MAQKNTSNLRLEKKFTSAASDHESQTIPNPDHKNSLEEFKKKQKKIFTLLRVEDDIIDGYRDYARINKLESHGPFMNKILRDKLDELFGKNS